MIKAETIIHEGNPGPNWLDQCRAVITPQNLMVVALLIVAVAAAVTLREHQHAALASGQETSDSQPAHSANPLMVSPAGGQTKTTATSNSTAVTNLQPANNAGDAALPGTPSSSSSTAGVTNRPNAVGPAPAQSSQSLQSVSGNALQQSSKTVQTVINTALSLPSGL